jgi:hypothetical protein
MSEPAASTAIPRLFKTWNEGWTAKEIAVEPPCQRSQIFEDLTRGGCAVILCGERNWEDQ